MKTKHTEGEWFISGSNQIVSMPSQCKITNRVSGWNPEEAKANAQLIATAPEMLEVLIEISEGKGRYDLDPIQHAANCIEDMKVLAVEAIKKATELKG